MPQLIKWATCCLTLTPQRFSHYSTYNCKCTEYTAEQWQFMWPCERNPLSEHVGVCVEAVGGFFFFFLMFQTHQSSEACRVSLRSVGLQCCPIYTLYHCQHCKTVTCTCSHWGRCNVTMETRHATEFKLLDKKEKCPIFWLSATYKHLTHCFFLRWVSLYQKLTFHLSSETYIPVSY